MNKKITSFLFSFFFQRSKFLMSVLIFLAVFVLGTISASANDFKEGEILFKYKDRDELNIVKVDNEIFHDEIEKLNNNDLIEYAEPNFLYEAAIIPSDLYYNNQWYLKKIGATEAWDSVRENNDLVIAIIDSGIQIDHPDLRDNIWRNVMDAPGNNIDDDRNGYVDDVNGWNFAENNADPSPIFSEGYTQNGIMHGTVVAGIAAASGNNASGISGVSWRTKIMPLKVLTDSGEGEVRNVIKAIDYAIDNGADIINFSFVGFSYSRSMEAAVRRAYEAGIIIVAAAGNEQGDGYGYSLDVTPIYPACYDGEPGENMVIGVAATDTLDQKAPFSSYGFQCVDVAAPGVSIFSTSVYSPDHGIDGVRFNKFYDGYWSGTSMATPIVSAAVALIQEANPRLTNKEVIDVLINSTDNINRLNPSFLGQLGSGRVNVEKATKLAKIKLDLLDTSLVYAPFSGKQSLIVVTDAKGEKQNEFLAYAENFLGGVNIATGDVDGDGIDEIVTGAGVGGGPHIRVFTKEGKLISQFFAFDKDFRGGVNIAVGDLNNDGQSEIITAAGIGHRPMVRIFDYIGRKRRQFIAYQDSFRGGVNVAVGDVNADGYGEIITGTGKGGGPQVRIFNHYGVVEGQFFAFDNRLRGGVKVSILNTQIGTRISGAKIITTAGEGSEPLVRIFDNHARIENQFYAYEKKFKGGINISAADFDLDGEDEVITGAAGGGAPHVRIFKKKGTITSSFYAFEKDFLGGVSVSSILKK